MKLERWQKNNRDCDQWFFMFKIIHHQKCLNSIACNGWSVGIQSIHCWQLRGYNNDMVRNVGRRMYGWIYMCSPTSCIIPVLAFSFPDWLNIIKYPFCNLPNNYLPNHSFNLFNFQKKKKNVFPSPSSSRAVPQEWNNDASAVQRACGENAELLQRATSCMCVCLSLCV